jgi:hypothetical protein
MSDAGLVAVVISSGVAVLGSASAAVFSSFTRRRDEQARRTGERIGRLESALDFERGRQEGLRQGREEAKRNGEQR